LPQVVYRLDTLSFTQPTVSELGVVNSIILLFNFCHYRLFAETKSSETRTPSSSLGKRRQPAMEDVVSCKNSAPHDVHPPVTEATARESQAYDNTPYNDSSLPLHVASQSLIESPWPVSSELPQLDQVSDASAVLQMVPTLVASLPSQVLQLIQSQSSPPTAGIFPSQNAVDASVHPLLSMVQQVIPPLHEYSPPLPSSHDMYPSHAYLQASHQPVQSSHYAEAHGALSAVHQSNVPLPMMRTVATTMRGSSSHMKSLPLTPKVIIVSGTGVSSATTIAGPPPAIVTTSAATKPPPPPPLPGCF